MTLTLADFLRKKLNQMTPGTSWEEIITFWLFILNKTLN